MRKLLFALLLLVCLSVAGQESATFSIEQLHEDFEVFQGSLEDFHPGLYWYRDKVEMDQVFQSGRERLTEPLTERQFYRVLASALSKVGCGHTYISISKSTFDKEFTRYLPIKLHFDSGKAYYLRTYGEEQVAMSPGSQITSINGVPMDSIYAACLDQMTGDGFIQTGKISALNDHFWYNHAELFDVYDVYEIEYLNEEGALQEINIPSMPKEEIYRYFFKEDGSVAAKRNLILNMDNAVPVLRIKSFFGWKEGLIKQRIEKKFKEAFTKINEQEVDELIIDLRGNGGGRVPWVLYSYFVNESFVFAKNADFIFSKSSAYYPHQKLHAGMKWIKRKWWHTWAPGSSRMSKIDSTRYEMPALYMTKPYQPNRTFFEGDVYILIDGFSFSAASDFAAMMKSSGLATIIGEESGGGYYGNTSMQKSYVTLPNSKLRLEIPLVRHQLNVDPDKNPLGRGVIPDHEVSSTLEDVLHGKDRQMEWTLDFIKNGSN